MGYRQYVGCYHVVGLTRIKLSKVLMLCVTTGVNTTRNRTSITKSHYMIGVAMRQIPSDI
jgi:hypothetical protein